MVDLAGDFIGEIDLVDLIRDMAFLVGDLPFSGERKRARLECKRLTGDNKCRDAANGDMVNMVGDILGEDRLASELSQ